MRQATRRRVEADAEPVRVLGRGLRAQRGVHLPLRTIREATGKTQVDVTRASQMDQADISRLEGRASFDDCVVSTLKRYVAALGGQLELVAAFGDKRIILSAIPADPSVVKPTNKPLQRTGRSASRTIMHESLYLDFISRRRIGANDVVKSTPESYFGYLNSVAKLINTDITPEILRSEIDINNIARKLKGKRTDKTISNYRSAMQQYVAMVEAESL